MSDLIEPRHRALLDVLVRHEVRFVLVGGVALQLRGFTGGTRDVDVTIATDDVNVGPIGWATRTPRRPRSTPTTSRPTRRPTRWIAHSLE